ncbi:hypothetical protein GCM10011506_48220 [Marivirga lumbricoides]|uniref:Uncharacterized protein n=1 Tax=Marivirga lumbricoides TaxID=1046115 RepID=A0ABQ1NAL1_9BACT|nr:hypothetical protein GCM10011506_48220 [Marivirga lumbricoides]
MKLVDIYGLNGMVTRGTRAPAGESTMQLVKTTDHTGSLPHTGSVKQFENYSGTTYTD